MESAMHQGRKLSFVGSDADEGPPAMRITTLVLQSEVIGDGDFSLEVAKTLREIATMIETGRACRTESDVYRRPRGTIATIMGASWDGEYAPRSM